METSGSDWAKILFDIESRQVKEDGFGVVGRDVSGENVTLFGLGSHPEDPRIPLKIDRYNCQARYTDLTEDGKVRVNQISISAPRGTSFRLDFDREGKYSVNQPNNFDQKYLDVKIEGDQVIVYYMNSQIVTFNMVEDISNYLPASGGFGDIGKVIPAEV